MSVGEVHLGDVGTRFVLTIYDGASVLNVSTASAKNIVFEAPDGTTDTRAASFTTDGTDGKIEWTTTAAGDLDQTGTWSIQAVVTIGGNTWSSDVKSITVMPNL